MAGRRTNLALLWASVLALISGVAAFLVGTESGWWVIVAHGVIALAIVVLIPWKTVIAVRGLERRRDGRRASIGLTLAVGVTLVTGFLLVSGEVESVGLFTTMQLHVASGLLTVSLTLVHTLQRPVPHRPSDISRRNALRTGATLAAAGGLWLVIEGVLEVASARGADRRFTGSHEITDPREVPYTQWINDSIQHLDPNSHEVIIQGTPHPVSLIANGDDVVTATLDCTGGWFTTQEFGGIRLDRLLGDASGESIVARSTTGYWRRFPIEQADRLYLVTHMANDPLRAGNGGPVRIVAPGRRGYWWVKWVSVVEIDDHPPWWQPPLPTA
ncbi:MAG: molybdopterin-dependent oxidoreductase [Actinomycetota bacterium]